MHTAWLLCIALSVSLQLVHSCPESWIQAVSPCSCSSTFKRRSAVGLQNQYAISCAEIDTDTLRNIFANISTQTDIDNVFEHFSATGIRSPDGYIENDFFRGLAIKSVSITRSRIRSFGAKAFRGVTDSLDLSYNSIRYESPL